MVIPIFFLKCSEQPEHVKSLFAEKAITFLNDFSDNVSNQIIEKVIEQKENAERGKEQFNTRMFLR
jgi:hypothetical protein